MPSNDEMAINDRNNINEYDDNSENDFGENIKKFYIK
jgi:hypothetical protein